MKIAIITDTHFGLRNDSIHFTNHLEDFYSNIFFPYLLENDIKIILHAGDIFDRRKYINFNTLKKSKEMFFDKLKHYDIKMVSIVGNHDTYYRSTNELNSCKLLLSEYDNIEIIDNDVKCYQYGNTTFVFLPWINQENSEKLLSDIKKYENVDFIISHLELSGYETLRGVVAKEGLSPMIFENFKQVLSGHYHYKSEKGNILYLGSPYEMTWADYNTKKGFYTVDVNTKQLNFIENPLKMFYVINYDDNKSSTVDDFGNLSHLKGKYVKLVVKNKTNKILFDLFIDELYKHELANLNVIEESIVFNDDGLDEENIDIETTQNVLFKFVDSLEIEKSQKEMLNILMSDLYQEALYMES